MRHDGEPELDQVLSDIALLQLGLAHEGFFVRGGVAVGALYIDDDMVFGPGLLDAHDAEQNAKTPRVVLHESAVKLVKRHVTYYGGHWLRSASVSSPDSEPPATAPQDEAMREGPRHRLHIGSAAVCERRRARVPL